jgi:glycosyltransferase involved in cell wall biosynthesis
MTVLGASPRVSVVINTYNHERFIAQALRSAIAQDFPRSAIEIIVVDDGSTDATPEVLSEFLPFIRYIRQENAGQVSAFNTGVAAASGEILAFLDGDDWWETDKISRVVATFDSNPNVAAVGHGYREVDGAGTVMATMSSEVPRTLSLDTPDRARDSAPFRVFLGTSRLAIRKSIIQRVLPVPPDLPFFDNFVFTQAIAISGAEILPESLCNYRIHSGSLYAGNTAKRERLWMRYRLLCGLLDHLPIRLARIGIPPDTIAAFLESDFVDRDRLKLILKGGSPRETFRVERTAFHISCSNPTVVSRCVKSLTFLLALLMPPRTFYQIHSWYGAHNLKRARWWISQNSATAPSVTRRNANIDADAPRA